MLNQTDEPLMTLRRVFRFSLRTLLLISFAAGSAIALWFNWGPWVKAGKLEGMEGSKMHPLYTAFSADGERMACWVTSNNSAGEQVNSQRLFSRTGKLIKSIAAQPGCGPAFSSDSTRVCVVNEQKEPELRSAKDGALVSVCYRDAERISKVGFSPDGKCLYVLPYGSGVAVFNVQTGERVALLRGTYAYSCSFVPGDSNRIVTCGLDSANLFDVAAKKIIAARPRMDRAGDLKHVVDPLNTEIKMGPMAQNRLLLLLANVAYVMDTHSGEILNELNLGTAFARDAYFSKDANHAFILDQSSTMHVFETSGKFLRSYPMSAAPSENIACADNRLYVGESSGNIATFDAESGTCVSRQKVPQLVALSPNGARFIANRQSPEIWELRRPIEWWGIVYLHEFWMTVFFVGACWVSYVIDFRRYR